VIEVGSGMSRDVDAVAAGRQAVSAAVDGLDQVSLVFLFASGAHAAQVANFIAEACDIARTEAVVGCSGMGVLNEDGEVEQQDAVAALAISGDAIEAVPFAAAGADAAVHIAEGLLPYSAESGLLCLFPDVAAHHPGSLIGSLGQSLPFPIVGAAASGTPMDPRSYQWCGREVLRGGVTGVLIRGDVKILTGVAQGCQPFGQAYAITKAEGSVIQEIAFAPAIDALKEALDSLTPDEKENVGSSIFVGLAMDEMATGRGRGDFLIRNLAGLNPEDGSIKVGESVEVGQTVQFNRRTPAAAHEDLIQTVQALSMELGDEPIRFGLYFNCLGRGYGLFGQPDHDVGLIGAELGRFPLVGFFGNGEFAPVGGENFVHSYTGSLAVFTDL
jgi:small ligand-binding sensory domain FIST